MPTLSPEEADSSAGEHSSPETPGETSDNYSSNNNNSNNNNSSHNNNNKSSSKKKREKKNRQPKIIMPPPPDASIPVFFEDDIRHRDGLSKKLSYEHDLKGNTLGTSRIEKSSSFKRKTKPHALEGLMSKELDISTNKKSSVSGKAELKNNNHSNNNNHDAGRQMEYNIVLLGDFGVGKTGKKSYFRQINFNFIIFKNTSAHYTHNYSTSNLKTF